jgi:hypothetical protein
LTKACRCSFFSDRFSKYNFKIYARHRQIVEARMTMGLHSLSSTFLPRRTEGSGLSEKAPGSGGGAAVVEDLFR